MQITEKDFEKLKQSDRIEYLLRRVRIDDSWSYKVDGGFYAQIFMFIILSIAVFGIFAKVYGTDPSFLRNVFYLINLLLRVLILLIILDFALFLIFAAKWITEVKKLRKRFFKFSISARNKNGN